MRARVIIAVCLLAAILGGGIFMAFYMDRLCGQLLDMIEQAQTNVIQRGSDDGKAFQQAGELWEKQIPIICSFVIHDQADLISQMFYQAKGFLDSQTWDEYLSSLGELTFLLIMIRDYDKPTVRSIL